MSNIYISEPHFNGKVVLNTTCGEIEVELWSKEAPMACRNFVQLCLEGYYDHTIFHRVVRKFIIQGGDPTGTGEGGESIYGEPFKTEIHSRLRFSRRGLIAMSCSNNKVDGSQFFFTLNEASELQGKHTIFGSVIGKTIYNMINLAEGLVDKETERPLYPKEIISTNVICNPFNDIIPRMKNISVEEDEPKSQMMAVKDYGLLSFGDEMEEDEGEEEFQYNGKGKSAHDHSKYSNLSSEIVKIDPNEELIIPEIIDLAPVIIEKMPKKKENEEKLEKLREESKLIQDELVIEFIRERAAEKLEQEQPEENLKTLTANKNVVDPLSILRKFSEKVKSSTAGDWFYKPLAVGDNDEVERKVFDPDVYNPEKYDLFDPRNPLNQRKRQGDEVIAGKPKTKRNE